MDVEEVVGGAVELGVYELLRQRLIREILVPQPAAGADWSTVVPAGVAWEVLSVIEFFVASAVVVNRAPIIDFNDASNLRLVGNPSVVSVPAASQTVFVFSRRYGANINEGGVQHTPLASDVVLGPGYTLKSATVNLDAGDQYSNIRVTVREWSPDAVERNAEWLYEQLR